MNTYINPTIALATGMIIIGLILSFGIWYGLLHLAQHDAVWKERFHGLLIAVLSLLLLCAGYYLLFSQGVCHL